MRKYSIFSSNGMSLGFHSKKDKDEYEHELMLLELKFYKKDRDKYGIWADNQNKYVKTIEEFNHWDGHFMENLLSKYGD